MVLLRGRPAWSPAPGHRPTGVVAPLPDRTTIEHKPCSDRPHEDRAPPLPGKTGQVRYRSETSRASLTTPAQRIVVDFHRLHLFLHREWTPGFDHDGDFGRVCFAFAGLDRIRLRPMMNALRMQRQHAWPDPGATEKFSGMVEEHFVIVHVPVVEGHSQRRRIGLEW